MTIKPHDAHEVCVATRTRAHWTDLVCGVVLACRLTTALGSLACLGVAAAFSSETPDDLNNGHLEIEFFTIGGIALLAVPLWALVSSFYTVPSFSDEQPA